jgi:transposase InsO family protein
MTVYGAWTRLRMAATIFNTDQGSQFNSAAFTDKLDDSGIAISIDGREAWRNNVFVERLWKLIPHEEANLKVYFHFYVKIAILSLRYN